MMIEEIAARLNAKKNCQGWLAKCPAHKDKDASLKLDAGNDGVTLAKCFAGCTFDAIVEASGIPKTEWFGAKKQEQRRSNIVAEYDYTDADDKLLYQVVRFEPKDFRQRRPDGKGGWDWRVPPDIRVLFRLSKVLAQIAKKRAVFIVEGEKDVLALEELGLVATCNSGGAGKWIDAYTETLRGADAVVIPDDDEPGRKHANLIFSRIKDTARSVRIAALPGANDAAEWIANGGTVEQLRDIVANAKTNEMLEVLADKRAESSPANGRKGGRPSAPPSSEVAREIADSTFKADGHYTLRHWRDRWFRFDHGWEEVSAGEIEKTVVSYLQNDEELASFSSKNYARNIIANMASFNLCGIPATVQMPCWISTGEDARNWMAFANGIAVDVWQYAKAIAEGSGRENHYCKAVSADLFSCDFVRYPWEPDKCPDMWLRYLEQVQPEEDAFDAVRDMMGLLLADTGKYEAFWQLYGIGSNGKTVLLDVLEAMLGRSSVCRVPLEALAPGTRFQSFPLAEAKANICGEMSTDTGRGQLHAIEGNFKHCVSGGDIEVERKGVDKSTGRCRARFVLSSNSLPTFVDKSNAIWRRLRIIPFGVVIPLEDADVDLAEKIIKAEMPSICRWAIDGLANVIQSGKVTECRAGKELKSSHRETCDHERTFLSETYETDNADYKISAKEVYEKYKTWMSDNGYRALGSAKFAARVQHVFPAVDARVMRIGDLSVRGYAGLRERIVTNVTTPDSL